MGVGVKADKAWEFLSNFESFELIKKDYRERHGRIINTRPAREISSPFSHARSYFRSASSSDMTVKPLLLYYGVVSLSRGLNLLLTKGLREAALAPSHGLSVQSWGDELSKDSFDIYNLKISINSSGTYPELCGAVSNRSLLRHNSSAVNFQLPALAPVSASIYSLGDVLSRVPELREQHSRWRGVHNTAHLSEFVTENKEGAATVLFKLSKRAGVTREHLDSIFDDSDYKCCGENACFEYRGPNDISAMPGITDQLGAYDIGDLHVVRRYPFASNLTKVGQIFLISYILGMLVRYYPTQWTALIRGQVADAALPTVLSAVEHVEKVFPQIPADYIQLK